MGDPVETLRDLGAPAWIIAFAIGLVVLTLLIRLLTVFAKQLEALQPLFIFAGRAISHFHNPEKKRRVRLRKRFADHLESQIRLLNNQEEWSDARFAELEAEVEFEGSGRSSILRILKRTDGVRRARSLSQALEVSDERLIILQGDPGSGKSVALRHLASRLAKRAATSSSPRSLLPVYVNLREWKIAPGEIVDTQAVHRLVANSLNKVNLRDVAVFVEDNFEKGLEDGTWLFLFDSFDEIPEVLSSSEVDDSIQRYRDALYQFLNDLNNTCRGIVASRNFRGPSTYGLATFRITPLSVKRRTQLIKKAELGLETRRAFLAALPTAEDAIQQLVDNPMFLGLLCEQLRDGGPFPTNSYTVFEDYVSRRLERDSPAVQRRFAVTAEQLRATAEEVAFTIGIEPSLGLSPSVDALAAAMAARGLPAGKHLTAGLSALVYTKLMRTDANQQDPNLQQVAFSHRRFQEYFATCVVLKDLQAVPPRILLKDARWRETAVTIFQTQPTASVRPVIESAVRMLDYHLKALSPDTDAPENSSDRIWLSGLLHLLRILDAGIVAHGGAVARVQRRVDSILGITLEKGVLTDQKWSIDVAGAASEKFRLELFRQAFKGHSQWLRTAAYRQLGRLRELPTDIADAVRRTLITMTQGGELRRERLRVDAQLRRLSQPREFLRCLRLLLAVPVVDFILTLVAISPIIILVTKEVSVYLVVLLGLGLAAIAHAGLYVLRAGPTFSWPSGPQFPGEDWRKYFGLSDLQFPGAAWRRRFRLLRPSGSRLRRKAFFEARYKYFTTWYIYFILRAVLLTFMFVLTVPGFAGFSAMAVGYVLYVTFWAPGALIAVLQGRLLGIWWWPLYPGLFAYSSLAALVKFCKKFLDGRSPKEVVILLARGSLLLLLWLAVIIGVELWVFALSKTSWWGISWWSVGFQAAFWIAVLWIYGAKLYQRVYDRILVARWAKETAVVSARELDSNLQRLSTTGGRMRYLRMLRRRQALLPDGVTITALTDMLRASADVPKIPAERRDGTTSAHEENSKNKRLAHEVRDEIAQLVEELISAEHGKAESVQEDGARGMGSRR